ncbi:hypothetical protein HanIR_Chr04g0182731 [Helianthus annuus]|nr:hypothetical protein HanIR_Chr04g0182731 [Helianthus annuus]
MLIPLERVPSEIRFHTELHATFFQAKLPIHAKLHVSSIYVPCSIFLHTRLDTRRSRQTHALTDSPSNVDES